MSPVLTITDAARLAPPGARGRALATVEGGITAATALGVPLTMVLGQAGGWRLPFLAVGALAGLAALVVAVFVPMLAPQAGPSLRERLGVLGRLPVAVGNVTIGMFWAGSLCAFTYVVPLLRDRTGLSNGTVIGVLFLAGAMSVLGTVLGGRGADRSPRATLLLTAGVTFVALLLFSFAAPVAVAAVILVAVWQLGAWAFVPAIQARVYELGGDTGEAAMSFSVAAFNVGIVAGAGLGGIALEASGLSAVSATAAVIAALAFALTAVVVRLRVPSKQSTVSRSR